MTLRVFSSRLWAPLARRALGPRSDRFQVSAARLWRAQPRYLASATRAPVPPLTCTHNKVHLPASPWHTKTDPVVIKSEKEDGVFVDSIEATLLVDSKCELAEAIIYDDGKNQLLWTDINGKKFYALDLPAAGDDENDGMVEANLTAVSLPKMLGSFAMRPKGKEGFICAFEDGFQLCSLLPTTRTTSTTTATTSTWHDWMLSDMSEGEHVSPLGQPTRMNDGRVDPTGKRFISGGYYGEDPKVFMKVFKCEVAQQQQEQEEEEQVMVGRDEHKKKNPSVFLKHEAIYEDIQITNSLCFPSSNDTMFLADSPRQEIYKIPYDTITGTLDLSAKRLFHKTNGGDVPDGSCIDAQGYVWNAVWRYGAGPSYVNRLHPKTGEIVYRVFVPPDHGTSQISCCCFGGPNLDILFMSSAAENRDKTVEPFAGGIYAAKVPFRGRPEVRFAY